MRKLVERNAAAFQLEPRARVETPRGNRNRKNSFAPQPADKLHRSRDRGKIARKFRTLLLQEP